MNKIPDPFAPPPFTTVNTDEINRFDAVASKWWDENGPFRPLHHLNPTRLDFICQTLKAHFALDKNSLAPFKGLKILDIGCGGGLVAEPLSRLGASVTAIDASEQAISVAVQHAAVMGLSIDYRCTSAETLALEGTCFDVVLGLEIVEHVDHVSEFLKTCTQLTKPAGALLLSTLNRTWKSWVIAIIGAEYVLKWLPKGTHDWNKFISPAELSAHLRTYGFTPRSLVGMTYSVCKKKWALSAHDLDVNYLLWSSR